MSSTPPPCRSVNVFLFRGDRSRAMAASFQIALDDEKTGRGSGPTIMDCQLFAGHIGVSLDSGMTIWGFNPDHVGIPVWQLLDRLKNGDAFPGVVRDDTPVFAAARTRGISILSFEVVLPEPQFRSFESRLDGERRKSQYSYGFPNGNGDCNCVTWLERLGLPLLTGRINDFVAGQGASVTASRRFGLCV